MSFIQSTKSSLIKNISNIPGWSTRRKLVVFLVDDWGAIRIQDKHARSLLSKSGVDCEANRFDKYDTLANSADLSALFDVLISVKDKNNKPASFTALTAVANPDFDRIKQSGFKEYFYEPFTETLNTYYPNTNVFELWKQGIASGIFQPQFHGREHLNVELWLKGLQNGDSNLLAAFDQKAIGIPMSQPNNFISSYMAAYDFEIPEQEKHLAEINKKGLDLFNKLFGYKASLFTASSLIHNNRLEQSLAKKSINFIDRAKISYEPQGGGLYKKKFYHFGEKNKYGQRYITRNCMFEPIQYPDKDIVNQTLNDINVSFRWNKPAIISSHRVNFVSGVDPKNRELGLSSLKRLLRSINEKWPDAEFLTFNELANLMHN